MPMLLHCQAGPEEDDGCFVDCLRLRQGLEECEPRWSPPQAVLAPTQEPGVLRVVGFVADEQPLGISINDLVVLKEGQVHLHRPAGRSSGVDLSWWRDQLPADVLQRVDSTRELEREPSLLASLPAAVTRSTLVWGERLAGLTTRMRERIGW